MDPPDTLPPSYVSTSIPIVPTFFYLVVLQGWFFGFDRLGEEGGGALLGAREAIDAREFGEGFLKFAAAKFVPFDL